MAEQYKTTRDVVIAGKAHAAGKAIELDADAGATRMAEMRGLIERAKEAAKPRQSAPKAAKPRARKPKETSN